MKRTMLILIAVAGLAACDKPAEKPAEPAAEAAKTDTTAAAAEAKEGDEPDAPAESASADGHDHDHGKEAAAKMPEAIKPGEQGFYGSKFTVIEAPITLAKAIEQAPTATGPVKLEATVKSVCKKKGCWFTMSGEGVETDVRVRMKDYSFFVPKNSDGAAVVAEGMLKQREIPQKEAQHYADDAAQAGEEPKKVDGPEQVWEFTATAVELKAAES